MTKPSSCIGRPSTRSGSNLDRRNSAKREDFLPLLKILFHNPCMLSISSKRFKPIAPERRVEKVWHQLYSMIYSGELKPGELLREAELSVNLGVSQVTVREALGKLEYLDLVVRTPHRHTMVKNLTRDELKDCISVRVALETQACWQALHNEWTEDDYRELESRAAKILKDPKDLLHDLAFHRYIWNRAGNATLLHSLLQVSSCLFGFISILRAARLQEPKARYESHQKFIQALREASAAFPDEKDETARGILRAAVKDHLDTAYKRFFDRNYPDFKSVAAETSKVPLVKIATQELLSLSTVSR